MHIVFYLAIVIADVLTVVLDRDLRAVENAYICRTAIYSVCNVIFGVILN